jgi:hypothetical protein
MIRTGDIVFHRPSGEMWLVAWADDREVVCCGWPESIAKVSDCELKLVASDEEHIDLVRQVAKLGQKLTSHTKARKPRVSSERKNVPSTPNCGSLTECGGRQICPSGFGENYDTPPRKVAGSLGPHGSAGWQWIISRRQPTSHKSSQYSQDYTAPMRFGLCKIQTERLL